MRQHVEAAAQPPDVMVPALTREAPVRGLTPVGSIVVSGSRSAI